MTNLKELRTIAKELGIRGYSTANKSKLIAMLENHPKAFKIRHTDAEADQNVAEAFELKPDDFENMSHEELEAKHKALQSHIEKKKAVEGAVNKPAARKPSPWNAFLREYSTKNGVSWKEAMTKKDEYKAWKEAQSSKSKE
jgi:hypothetical protein